MKGGTFLPLDSERGAKPSDISVTGGSMRRPICAKCKREMPCVKNEVMVKDKAADGFPSTYWYGDQYECPECGAQIITGFGNGMSAEKAGKTESAKTALEFA